MAKSNARRKPAGDPHPRKAGSQTGQRPQPGAGGGVTVRGASQPAVLQRGQLLAHAAQAFEVQVGHAPRPGLRRAWPCTSPQGSMTMLWPQVRRPFSCVPPWALAITKAWFSMARARSSTSQWACPVVWVKAERAPAARRPPACGTARQSAGRSTRSGRCARPGRRARSVEGGGRVAGAQHGRFVVALAAVVVAEQVDLVVAADRLPLGL
jgi:hypothetical protein